MKLLNEITDVLMDPAAMKAAMIAIPFIAMPLSTRNMRRPAKWGIYKEENAISFTKAPKGGIFKQSR